MGSGQWAVVSGGGGGGGGGGGRVLARLAEECSRPDNADPTNFNMLAIPKSPVRSFRDLIVWQRSMELIQATYSLSEEFPKREMYGLVAQMRRAVISIPANIAEGQERGTTRDFLRFLSIAAGSLRELQTYLEVSLMLRYATEAQLAKPRELADETGRILRGLRDALRRRKGP